MNALILRRGIGMGRVDNKLEYVGALIIISFLSLAVYNTVEIVVKIFARFRRYGGVYFYSMLAASLGITIHAFGYFLHNFGISKVIGLDVTLACGGGMLMITGQSIVLWSRLNLISPGKKDLWLLWMILAACVFVQGGATTLFAGSNSAHPDIWIKVYRNFEIFQVTYFFFQECLISGLYIFRAFVLTRSSAAFRGPDAKRVFYHLILVNIFVILLDITVLAFQYSGHYAYQTSFKTFAYSLKLKLEFDILHQLVVLTQRGFGAHSRPTPRHVTGAVGGVGAAHNGLADIGGAHMGTSRFGNSTYARMDEHSLHELPAKDVVKTKVVRVHGQNDAASDASAPELGPDGNLSK